MVAGVHGAGSPLGQPSIDATAQGGFWVTEPAHLGVDAHTAALRERLRDASMFARLSGLLRRAG
jgi:hypothetical protein